jgi:hypothetical protein
MTPDFARSTQTNALIDVLRAASVGSVVSYAALSAAIGEDVTECRHYLYTAVNALQGEGIAFGTVRSEGVKRLVSEEIPAIGESAMAHIRRTSRRARKRMGVVSSMNDVPNDVRIKVNATASMLGVIENFSGNKSRKVVEAEVTRTNGPIPPMKLLEALKA